MSEPARPPQKIRLLLVISDLDGGGAQRVTLGLLAQLDPQRYAVTLLVLAARGALSAAVPSQVRVIHRPPLCGLRLGGLMTLLLALRHDLLIAAMELRTTYYVHRAAKWLRKPAVLWVHIAFAPYIRELGHRHQQRSRAAYSEMPNLVFVAEGARRSMAAWLGFEGESWRVIPNLFDAARYPQTRAAALPLAADRPLLLGIGRLETRKGFDLLVDAAALLLARGSDVQLAIIGDGEEREALLQRAARAGLGDRLLLPGFVGDPLAWLRAASIYVLSSRLEGLPTTILEAFASGTPVVATDCPSGPAELLGDSCAGLLVPVDDAAAIADAVQRLLGSAALREQLTTAARQRLREFLPAAVGARWDELLCSLAGSSA